MTPETSITGHTRHGKWSQPGVPHRGWTCVAVDDLDEPAAVCAMCESAEIRFVHTMTHPDFPDELGVGCVCAEHMEEDYQAPKAREQQLRNTARRRKTWSQRAWLRSVKGNLYLKAHGFRFTIFRQDDHWSFCVQPQDGYAPATFARRHYATLEAAQQATFDALLWAQTHYATD